MRPPLVAIAGLAATAELLRPAFDDLARDHHVVTVELPGHGINRGGGAPTIDGAVSHLRRIVERLGHPAVTLFGWSLGATVAYRYLERYGPDRVGSFVSVEQTPRLLVDPSWPHGAFGSLDSATAEQLLATDYPTFAATLAGASFAAGTTPDPLVLQRLIDATGSCDPGYVRSLLAEAVADDSRDRVRRISVPTLLIHGARSQVYPTAVGAWLAEAMPDARLEVFPDSGHLPFLEEMGRFLRVVRSFTIQELSHA